MHRRVAREKCEVLVDGKWSVVRRPEKIGGWIRYQDAEGNRFFARPGEWRFRDDRKHNVEANMRATQDTVSRYLADAQ